MVDLTIKKEGMCMRKFKYGSVAIIPKSRKSDVLELARFIVDKLDIEITIADTYRFWCDVSEYLCASWLDIDFHCSNESREEFILRMMEKFGAISG